MINIYLCIGVTQYCAVKIQNTDVIVERKHFFEKFLNIQKHSERPKNLK